jgi:Transposase IS200 like
VGWDARGSFIPKTKHIWLGRIPGDGGVNHFRAHSCGSHIVSEKVLYASSIRSYWDAPHLLEFYDDGLRSHIRNLCAGRSILIRFFDFGSEEKTANEPKVLSWVGRREIWKSGTGKSGADATFSVAGTGGWGCFSYTQKIGRYHGRADLHFVTFSCNERRTLLGRAYTRDLCLKILEQVRRKFQSRVVGYVVMPEHVHWLIGEPQRAALAILLQSTRDFAGILAAPLL